MKETGVWLNRRQNTKFVYTVVNNGHNPALAKANMLINYPSIFYHYHSVVNEITKPPKAGKRGAVRLLCSEWGTFSMHDGHQVATLCAFPPCVELEDLAAL